MDNILGVPQFLWTAYRLNSLSLIQLEEHSLPTKLKYTFGILFFVALIINTIFQFGLSAVTMLRNSDNLQILTIGVIICFGYIEMSLKYSIVFIKQNRIKSFLKRFPKFYDESENHQFKVDKRLRKSRVPFYIYTAICVYNSVKNTFHNILIGEFFNNISFPFSVTNPFTFVILDLWLLLSMYVIMLCNVLIQRVTYGAIVLLVVEMEKLRDEILSIKLMMGNPAGSEYTMNFSCVLKQKVKLVVQRHAGLLAIRNEFDEIFSLILMVTFLCSLIMVCFSELMSFYSHFPMQKFVFLMMAVAQSILIVVQCTYGQQLKDANDRIVQAIYECKWEEIEDQRIKRDLLIMLTKAQNFKGFTCWKLFENSNELLGDVS